MPFGNRNISEDLSISIMLELEKCHPSGNLKFNYSGISQSFKLLISMEKILSISLRLSLHRLWAVMG